MNLYVHYVYGFKIGSWSCYYVITRQQTPCTVARLRSKQETENDAQCRTMQYHSVTLWFDVASNGKKMTNLRLNSVTLQVNQNCHSLLWDEKREKVLSWRTQ